MKDQLHQLELKNEVTTSLGKLTLSWEKESSGFHLFHYKNQREEQVDIKDDADYLLLFMQVAEAIYSTKQDPTDRFLIASSVGGKKLYLKQYTKVEQENYKWAYIALNASVKALQGDDHPGQVGFYCEVSYESTQEERFEKESKKVAKILKGDNRDDWLKLVENGTDFIKTDVYVLALQKLHSWGFQAIDANGKTETHQTLVRPIRPIPRGAIRKKRKAK